MASKVGKEAEEKQVNQNGYESGKENSENEEMMQESYTSHHPVVRNFRHPRVLAFSLNYQWDGDTANMVKYKDYNDGYSYFAVFTDIFSRFLYTYH